MANTNQITVVTGLPQYAGRPRAREPYFKSEVTAKFFIDALENYFASNGIRTEEAKLSIFYNMIDHTKGDALTLIPCFKGAKIQNFHDIKDQFLEFYESDKQTEFQPAAKAFMRLDLKDDASGNLTKLNNIAKNLAEAYVTSNQFLGKEYDQETLIANEALALDPPEAHRYYIGTKGPIKLVEVLQNLLMHTDSCSYTQRGGRKSKNIWP